MSLDHGLLRTLVALVEERNVTRAARRLGLAQPTVSGALARLRDALGDPLLVRDGRRLAPTARALALVAEVTPHLDAIDAAVAGTTSFEPAQARRVFRLGCTDAVAFALLPALSARLRQAAPGCDLLLRTGDFRTLPDLIATGAVSAALAYLRDDPSATARIRAVRRSPWVVLRDASSRPITDLDAFCDRPHALVTPSGDLGGLVDDALAAEGRTRRVALGLTSFALLLAALPGDELVATVPDFVAARLAALAPLAVDPCPVAVAPVVNSLAWSAVADRDPGERWFREVVRETFAAAQPR
ncbi:LysR substrate-binding domain-containing protein [Salinarimonas rosea]|uniref:LysR substrate-binding domain-containing protein n=1 Tax=Salinarimonas rosea TaxID=552063 RepID=UPI00040A31A0|nr:LysR substrate-binding domain-containing protein [Salinarimonas rosea]